MAPIVINDITPIWGTGGENKSQIEWYKLNISLSRFETTSSNAALTLGRGELYVRPGGNRFYNQVEKVDYDPAFSGYLDKCIARITDLSSVVINYKIHENGDLEYVSYQYTSSVFYLSESDILKIKLSVAKQDLQMNNLYDKMFRLNREYGTPFIKGRSKGFNKRLKK